MRRYIDFELIDQFPNKYNLRPKDIKKLKIIDWAKLKKKTWHNQAMLSGTWWCHLEGCNLSGSYDDFDEFWIGFNEDNNEINYHFRAGDGMCHYKFDKFYEAKDIENKYDMNVQVNAIRYLNELLDEGIIAKE